MSNGGRRRRNRSHAQKFNKQQKRAFQRALDLPSSSSGSSRPYVIGKYYNVEEFKLINFSNPYLRMLTLKDPASDASINCTFLGNKGDREGPVKIDVGDGTGRDWCSAGELLHVFCAKDLHKYLRTNNTCPFDVRLDVLCVCCVCCV